MTHVGNIECAAWFLREIYVITFFVLLRRILKVHHYTLLTEFVAVSRLISKSKTLLVRFKYETLSVRWFQNENTPWVIPKWKPSPRWFKKWNPPCRMVSKVKPSPVQCFQRWKHPRDGFQSETFWSGCTSETLPGRWFQHETLPPWFHIWNSLEVIFVQGKPSRGVVSKLTPPRSRFKSENLLQGGFNSETFPWDHFKTFHGSGSNIKSFQKWNLFQGWIKNKTLLWWFKKWTPLKGERFQK